MGVRSLKMKLQAFQLLRNLFRPLWYNSNAPSGKTLCIYSPWNAVTQLRSCFCACPLATLGVGLAPGFGARAPSLSLAARTAPSDGSPHPSRKTLQPNPTPQR